MGLRSAHVEPQAGVNLNWDDIRLFLKLAERGSIRAVALETGHSPAALRGRINDLEAQTGALLFQRSRTGMTLTETGRRLLVVAEGIQRQARVFATLPGREKAALRASVKVGITEGLGVFWLAPLFSELRHKHPEIQFDLRCSMTLPKISELEVDLAIQLEKPTDPDLMVRRIGSLHIVLFASEAYIATHGAPESKTDIHDFHFIEVEGPQIRSERVQEEMTNEDKRRFVNLRVNSSSAQFVAAISGLGVTAFPTYAPVVTQGLVHVAKDFVLKRDIWLAYHPQSATLPHVRRTIDWIVASFDPARFPWFRETYFSPEDIQTFMEERQLRSLVTPAIELNLTALGPRTEECQPVRRPRPRQASRPGR
ncbi:MAG: LysR family transcriptional regulator [Bosea sp. (in: a-proteobacteria)]|uniref:LysR family transcriptional regulator n=1 Tax=Bosea sp. (in: a-proteobacteria) TaxID=1871050 RepID=UPI0027353AF6|nr:LysR family transcriptional regulator [Bosea sp. (in: a-proteobacteria)]MDP3601262.1 LysR family transcriptional regulator [Bosea sp. (in: a-proteobacteria)]